MSELTVAAEPERMNLEASCATGVPAGAGEPAERGPVLSFLIRQRVPLLAVAALGASIAIGWLANGAFDGEAKNVAAGPSERGAQRRGAPRSEESALRAGGAAQPGSSPRVASDAAAHALFAPHSWHVDPPPPPPAPPEPPPPPTAPPFPYAYLGAYTQGGDTVYFLSREDRVTDAHVGDHLDSSYVFESADASQLVFKYVPLNIRQTIPLAAVKP